jgi:hypothetical protein
MENHGGVVMSTEENSRFVHQSSLAMLPAESSGNKQEKWIRIKPYEVFLLILASDFYIP